MPLAEIACTSMHAHVSCKHIMPCTQGTPSVILPRSDILLDCVAGPQPACAPVGLLHLPAAPAAGVVCWQLLLTPISGHGRHHGHAGGKLRGTCKLRDRVRGRGTCRCVLYITARAVAPAVFLVQPNCARSVGACTVLYCTVQAVVAGLHFCGVCIISHASGWWGCCNLRLHLGPQCAW